EPTAKPGVEGAKETKGNAAGAAEKPAPEASNDGKGEVMPAAAGATAETKAEPKAAAVRPKPEKITWTEQRTWRDGIAARLQGANSAYSLTRKITSTRPRTAMVQIAGPTGFRMWVNGELAQTSLPPPPAAPPKAADAKPMGAGNGPDAKDQDDKEEPAAPEINDAAADEAMGRGRNSPERKFRIGLRQGENEIVVKVVLGDGAGPGGRRAVPGGGAMGGGPPGGGMFTFALTPEGDDILTHEVATALRL